MSIRQPYLNLLRALVIIAGGFVLFNGAFLLAAVIINSSAGLIGREMASLVFLALILLVSGGIALSKLNDTIKAMVMTMPLMTILILIGIRTYGQPIWIPIGISALLLGMTAVIAYLKKLVWQYYFAILYVALLGLYIVLMGIEI